MLRLVKVGALALSLAGSALLATATHATAQPAGTTADSCTIIAQAPTYANGTVTAAGEGSCRPLGNDELVVTEVTLTRDGQTVASDWTGCEYSPCEASASAPNRSGNQQWCTYVEVSTMEWGGNLKSWGRHSSCENASW
ncbi:hypothetical protein FM076_01225 [Streptomyces albus subsp. chlorinus]|uniref:hypothetical protein n=1 Tax=Streptomyces albus TaxID=1888 RepID=UPI00156E96F3|nr:hypothetical protein [Streptomyces albus]NSC19903.1 hypothetical protein [Streptomyces albus subsp. chlorinus]